MTHILVAAFLLPLIGSPALAHEGLALTHGGVLILPLEPAQERQACLFCCDHSCNGAVAQILPPVSPADVPERVFLAGYGWTGFQGRIRIN